MSEEKGKEITKLHASEATQSWLTKGFEKALEAQLPLAVSTVSRLRRVHPEKSPKQLIDSLSKWYIGVVAGSGASAGLASTVPNGFVQAPVALTDLTAFFEASVLYVLTAAEIYDVDVEDLERRRFLVMTALLGNTGTTTVTQALGKRTVPYWSKQIINRIPMQAINQANKVLGTRFITKYGTRQGVLVLGKQLPLTLGAVVGASGNAAFGYAIVRSTKKVLGTPPENWSPSPDDTGQAPDSPVTSDVETEAN
ncbi:hypothetical protein ACN4EB_07090 [Corynebacterium macclintockiae]|uniref:hypothetical protein n=1 Tax=Corynebacterium macclintockiae TaxID=2913501 RepID=UPI000B1D67A5|nr:hypothetical protein [Corynebacterium macclintockiae]MDK8870190.1 hypothetical protein [Corynebacterium macclintockiae]